MGLRQLLCSLSLKLLSIGWNLVQNLSIIVLTTNQEGLRYFTMNKYTYKLVLYLDTGAETE